MSDAKAQVVYFYDRHPISSDIILAKLRASRGHLDGLRPDELFPHDQDHYGGLAATDELARGAQIANGSRVADFCAGLGGTVRYLAHKYGAKVTGIELTPSRVSGAQELIKRVGLEDEAYCRQSQQPRTDRCRSCRSQSAACRSAHRQYRWLFHQSARADRHTGGARQSSCNL